MDPIDNLALLTVADVASLWKRSPAVVRRLIRDGKLPVVRLEGDAPIDPHRQGRRDYRVRRDDALAFIQARTVRLAGFVASGEIRTRKPTPKPSVSMPFWDGIRRLGPKKARAKTER